jgi:hypothetical protein
MRDDIGVFVPTLAEYKGRVFLLRNRGEVVCLEPATGKTIWSAALPKGTASYYASPVIANGILYAAREDGVVFAARVEDKFELLSENPMGERVVASPAVSNDRLLIRGDKHLFCIQQNDATNSTVTVCSDGGAGGYEAFPDVCRLADGRLQCIFYASYAHVGVPNERWPRGGKIGVCWSKDEGRTWSEPETLFDSPADDRDPSITQLKDGRLVCSFFTSGSARDRSPRACRSLGRAAADRRRSWSEFARARAIRWDLDRRHLFRERRKRLREHHPEFGQRTIVGSARHH